MWVFLFRFKSMIQQGQYLGRGGRSFPSKGAGIEPFSSQAPNALFGSAAPVWLQEGLPSGTRQDNLDQTPLSWMDSSFSFHHFMAWICPLMNVKVFSIAVAKTGRWDGLGNLLRMLTKWIQTLVGFRTQRTTLAE